MSRCIYCGKQIERTKNNPEDFLHNQAEGAKRDACVCNTCDKLVTRTNRALYFYISRKWTAENLSCYLADLADHIRQGEYEC